MKEFTARDVAVLDIADLARKLMRVRELRAHAFTGQLDARASDVTAELWALAAELAPDMDVEAVLEQVRAHGPDLEAALEHIQREPS